MSKFNIAVIQGDGIGPEVTDSAMAVLTKIGERYNHTFNFTPSICGGCAYDKYGEPLPKESLDICLNSDSVFTRRGGRSSIRLVAIRVKTRARSPRCEKGNGLVR